ncbi:glycosyltransferase family 2 protein [Rhodobacter sp. Har01]|uniref:glycosyltransferase family 2 protein n=1 Tax=Rhodobacter sp. Har01 TaxID=2883999 RepID=UPI001D09953B|nr:glycosyltransferase family 2 protein [Rhodobacter sp. Har01]MCB6176840.1 glycosyltransferase family 2 protein [Rhodobacter sp. Har01]
MDSTPPTVQPRPGRAGQRILAVTTLRNEASFLLEWLAHHRACGFTDFLVFSNDCTDGTDAMLDRLAEMGWLTHVPNDGPHDEGPQWAALKSASRHPLVAAADWILVLDIDEFVNVHVGDRTVPALLDALPQATAIPLTWRLFGNAGVVACDGRAVTETFTRAAPAVLHWPWRAMLFKTLFRNDGSYGRLGVHRPRAPDPERLPQARWFDGSGEELPEAFRTARIFSDLGRDHYRLVQLNHYALGSMESFLVKADRGRANRDSSVADVGYWVERNFSAAADDSILALDSRALRADLRADARLGRLHQAGLDWRRNRFRTLMAQEPWRALFGRLLMCPPTRVLPPEVARLVWGSAPAPPPPGRG